MRTMPQYVSILCIIPQTYFKSMMSEHTDLPTLYQPFIGVQAIPVPMCNNHLDLI